MSEFFAYRGGELCAEGLPVAAIAVAVGTPFYLYSAAALAAQYRHFAAGFEGRALVCYAVKANSNQAVLSLFARLGAGADVVSEGELRRALAAGIRPERIVFSGVGKTRAEMAAALAAGVHQINVESLPELHQLSEVAQALGRTAKVAIRVNPDIDARTHPKITTGKRENKFGVALAEVAPAYSLAAQLSGVEPVGLAVHIGSQLVDLAPYRRAFERIAGLVRQLRADGFSVARVDLGGGLGIRYHAEEPPTPEQYAALAREIFAPLDVALAVEPGRVLVGEAGLLVARVILVKQGAARRFVVVDAAMNDLLRPALYDAWHEIMPIRQSATAELLPADIVGPVCETGDTFGTDRNLPPLAEGDLLAFAAAGAYGAVMSSAYNSRLPVPEVLVDGARFAVVRARPSYDALLALEHVPDWLGEVAE
ncbi:MAG TPA: diaminopimelate decarboxylase [Stellaceae bacterium]|nr:diaminopimelate decarboxylase [Stellaceae bacterium]